MSQQPFPPSALRGAVDLSALKRPAAPARGDGPPPAGGPAGAGAAGPGTPAGGLVVTGTDATFQDFVNASLRYPVVVVLWSSRLPESGDFVKVVGGLAATNGGRFQVVSVDVDENPGLLRALQVQQVPMTIALLQGRPLPLFVGPLLPQEVQPVIDELLQVAVQNGVTGRVTATAEDPGPSAEEGVDEADEEAEPELPPHLAAAYEAIEAGDLEAAATAYEQALAADPSDAEAKAGLAQVGLLRRTEGVDPAAARAAAEADPTDVDAQILAADLDLLDGNVADAFTRLVDTVRATAGEERNQAREHLLELFEVVGSADERVTAGRRSLMSALF
jgi:putative thioredoxin